MSIVDNTAKRSTPAELIKSTTLRRFLFSY